MDIHPSLLNRNTSKLRSSLRPVASAALNGSVPDLVKLCNIVKSLPEDQAIGLLPVFYTHLDPSLVPSPAMVDDVIATSTELPSIECAVKSLRALATLTDRMSFPLETSVDLWPRLWRWVDFIHTYWPYLPGFNPSEQRLIRPGHTSLILKLAVYKPIRDVIYSSPRLRRLIAGAWASMLHYDVPDGPTAPRASLEELTLHLFALSNKIEEPQNFEEILDAFGGNHHDLAATLIKHISRAVAQSRSHTAAGTLNGVLMFLQPMMIFSIYPDFTSALVSCGIVSSLVSSLKIKEMDPMIAGVQHRVTEMALPLLIHFIESCPGFTGVEEALRAGLLAHLIRFSEDLVHPRERGVHRHLVQMFRKLLPSALVSYNVVVVAKKLMPALERAAGSEKFLRCAIYAEWNGFKTLVGDRVEVLDAWEASGRESLLACDNLKCGEIADKQQFQCCAACESAVYCSPDCQRADWDAGHREFCPSLQATHLQFDQLGLTTRDRVFMRLVLHSDFRRLQPLISRHTTMFILKHPSTPFYTHFDYTGADAGEIQVLPRTDLLPAEGLTPQRIKGHWDRLARSGARMELHVMRILVGKVTLRIVFPLRTTSTRLVLGLRQIGLNRSALVESQVEALLAVLIPAAEKDGRQIH
ncbi:hypothetical protein B0H16DRAFT_1512684 [Mycena metata]|uniref:MYND-type domain-containing protein n=1 Tax=Mycena metata TaxID=1033252 RepID=A0AAD7JUT2_9AGAR|nr:hypothetical protein B0H16DRAFT_1512684 [Mycena metata]